MSPKTPAEAPRHLNALQARIRNVAARRGVAELRLRQEVANVIVGQMLPGGAIKGGAAMQLRHGGADSRLSLDVDVTREAGTTTESYISDLDAALQRGWSGFSGRVVAKEPATPVGVPPEYVMAPFAIKLAYHGRSWLTVTFELGHEEINSLARTQVALHQSTAELFAALGLPKPALVRVLDPVHQIAQKLHACSAPGSERAHDLVDLQLLVGSTPDPDLETLAATARRLFIARHGHPWPPVIAAGVDWAAAYAEAARDTDVLATVEEAVVWANELIARVSHTG